ncbi:Abi family protein [Tissierellaceae bacterium HCP3S3_D8]
MDKFKEELIKVKDNITQEDLENQKRKYPKKSFKQLIDLLDKKGVKFNKTTKEDASLILRDINYYYKLTVYKRNFRRDKSDKFVNLEFSYLTDLASMDMQLRYILLTATLDIEHALKTFLITKITENTDVDGFDVVRSFFHSTTGSFYKLDKDIILENVKHKSHYQFKLYETHKAAPPAWVLMEVIKFGDFLRFFGFYFKKYPTEEFKVDSLMGVLNSVKRIRNASAHNNAFLFNLYDSNINIVSNYIKKYAEERKIGELFYKCNKVHDVLCVFYIHEFFVKGKGSRQHRVEEFGELTKKFTERFSYMDTDNDILYFLKILNLVLDKYEI